MKSHFCEQDGNIFCCAVAFLLQYLKLPDTNHRRDLVGRFGYSRRMERLARLGNYRKRRNMAK